MANRKMIVCTTEQKIREMFDDIKKQGFEWNTPLFLDSEGVWDDTDIPQVEEYCPNCRMLTDRNFNCTNIIDGYSWTLQNCMSCNAVWFDKDMV